VQAPIHPIDELRAARRDLLAVLQGCTVSDLLRPGVEGDWCGRDVLLHLAAWLRELACLVPDLATYGYQRGAPCDPRLDWAAWNAAQIALQRTVRPEAAVAGVVTAHARLLETIAGLDDAGLRRRGPTRFGFETSGWDLLVAEATHEWEHAACLAAHMRRRSRWTPTGPCCSGTWPRAGTWRPSAVTPRSCSAWISTTESDRALLGAGRLQPAGGGAGTSQPGGPEPRHDQRGLLGTATPPLSLPPDLD
jgi:DinB superfamily